MVSRRGAQEEYIPSDIFWGDNNNSCNFGAQSCVSSVTRELPDIDAPQLYPSIDCVAEVPDLRVSEHDPGRFEVTSNHSSGSRKKSSEEFWDSGHGGETSSQSSRMREDFQRHRSTSPSTAFSRSSRKSSGKNSEGSHRSESSREKALRTRSSHSLSRHFESGGGDLGGSDYDRRLQTQSHSYHGANPRKTLSLDVDNNNRNLLSREERRESSRLLSQLRSSGHARNEVKQMQYQQVLGEFEQDEMDYQQPRATSGTNRARSPPKSPIPTRSDLGYGSAASSPRISVSGSTDHIPTPARRMSYNSAALSLQSSGDVRKPEQQHHKNLLDAVTPENSLSDAPPQRPQRRLSASEHARINRHTAPSGNTSYNNNNNNRYRSSGSRNNQLNNPTPGSGSRYPRDIPHRSVHSSGGMSRESQHSFCEDSVQSSVTGWTQDEYPPDYTNYDYDDRAPRIPEEGPYRSANARPPPAPPFPREPPYQQQQQQRRAQEPAFQRNQTWDEHNQYYNERDFRPHPSNYEQQSRSMGSLEESARFQWNDDRHQGAQSMGSGEDSGRFQWDGQHRPSGRDSRASRPLEPRPAPPRPRDPEQRILELEIQPGVFVPLRGTAETVDAMNHNFILHTTCFACTAKVLCIADSEYVLCPVCKVVSPIEHNIGSGTGVGLGLKEDDDN